VDLRYEADWSGSEFPLSGGIREWIDDLIAGGVVIIIASVVASRLYRWARAQGDHPRDLMEAKARQLKEAGGAAGRALRGGHGSHASSPPDGEDLEPQVSVGSTSQV